MPQCAYRLPRMRKADHGGEDEVQGRGQAPQTRRPGMGRIPGPVLHVAVYVPCSAGNPAASGRLAQLPRAKGHITSMPWRRRGCKRRGGLQPVALQKKLQGCPAGSPHSASPALNAFNLSTWMPLQVHPANIRAGNFLFADIAHRWIGLVTYPSLYRSGSIDNLASWVKGHACILPEVDLRTCQDCTRFRSCAQLAPGGRVWYNRTGGGVYEPRTARAGETR